MREWPPGISDGLVLSCGVCGQHTDFDYTVNDDFWRRVVPDHLRLGVVCLSCLDDLAAAMGEDVSLALERVQFTGRCATVLLEPKHTYYHTRQENE